MKLTREQVYDLIKEEADYALKYDCKDSKPPRSLADKDKPLELWLLWVQQYVNDAVKAATTDYDREEALTKLRCALSMGVNAAIYHGLPSRNHPSDETP